VANTRNFNNISGTPQLAAAVAATDTTISLTSSTANFPTTPFTAAIDQGLASEEIILVGAITGTTMSSLTRGFDGTAAQAHGAGGNVTHVVASEAFNKLYVHLDLAANTPTVANPVGTTDAQTLTNKIVSGSFSGVASSAQTPIGTPGFKFTQDAAGRAGVSVANTVGATAGNAVEVTNGATVLFSVDGAGAVTAPAATITTLTGTTSHLGVADATTLKATAATTLQSTLAVTGATTLSSTLAVTGATTLSSTLSASGAVSAGTGLSSAAAHLQLNGRSLRQNGNKLELLDTDTGNWGPPQPAFAAEYVTGATTVGSLVYWAGEYDPENMFGWSSGGSSVYVPFAGRYTVGYNLPIVCSVNNMALTTSCRNNGTNIKASSVSSTVTAGLTVRHCMFDVTLAAGAGIDLAVAWNPGSVYYQVDSAFTPTMTIRFAGWV
jgi:hypothetical protein